MTIHHPRMSPARRRPLWPGVLALFVAGSLIVSLGGWLHLPDLVRLMVHRLSPPAYPGAVVVEQNTRTEFGTSTEDFAYRVPEQVYTVRAWLEQRMPGFATCETATTYIPDCSTNLKCDTSIISTSLIHLMLGDAGRSAQACVSVLVRADPSDEHYTLIRTSMNWPAMDEQAP